MSLIKKIITLTLCASLNLCIFPVAASTDGLDLTADPITPSNQNVYAIDKLLFQNQNFGFRNIASNINESYDLSISSYSVYTSIETSDLSVLCSTANINSILDNIDSSNLFIQRTNSPTGGIPLLELTYTYFYDSSRPCVLDSLDITYQGGSFISRIDGDSSWNTGNSRVIYSVVGSNYSCPLNYGLHTDNFCYPLTEVYDYNNQICSDYATANPDYIIQGIWDSIIPTIMLVKVPEQNVLCSSDAQYELLSGNSESTIKVIVHENRTTSKNYLGNTVNCVDVYYIPTSIGVTATNYLSHPQSYPVANIAPSSVFCDPNDTILDPSTDSNFLDNPLEKKCIDDLDCDGIKNDVDTDIDNDGILNDADLDDDNDGFLDVNDGWPWDDDNDDDGFKDGDSRDTDNGGGENNDVPNDGYSDIPDCDVSIDATCQANNPDGTVNCVGDLLDIDGDGVCNDVDFDDNNPSCQNDNDGDGYCNDIDFDDSNALCWIDNDGDGFCNDRDVDDNDASKTTDYQLESIEICDALYPVVDSDNEVDVLNCYFREKIVLRFDDFTREMQDTGFLATYSEAFSTDLKTGIQNENGEITVLGSSSSYSCPSLSSSSFEFAGQTVDIADNINLCDDRYNLFYDLMYWFIVSSCLIYILLNTFRR